MSSSSINIDIDFDFDPHTWCRDTQSIDINQRPIRKLICVAIDLLDILTPLTRFVELLIHMVKDFMIDNHNITEMVIILSPAIPIGVLVGYFLDTL